MKATMVSTYFINGHVYTMNENEAVSEVVQPTRRRRHSKEFKEKVIRAAMQPNVSIAAVALHYQLNAMGGFAGGTGGRARGAPVDERRAGGVRSAATASAGRGARFDGDSDRGAPRGGDRHGELAALRRSRLRRLVARGGCDDPRRRDLAGD
jgi:hypothetical protein